MTTESTNSSAAETVCTTRRSHVLQKKQNNSLSARKEISKKDTGKKKRIQCPEPSCNMTCASRRGIQSHMRRHADVANGNSPAVTDDELETNFTASGSDSDFEASTSSGQKRKNVVDTSSKTERAAEKVIYPKIHEKEAEKSKNF